MAHRSRIREGRTIPFYGLLLRQTLAELAPPGISDPCIVLLTPGVYNSAFYEHMFLAREMGVELVQGEDLLVHNGFVYMPTTGRLQRVDVIYRRVDDDFLDPLVFRPDSQLGTPGLFYAYQLGNVAIANAPGTGVADDKSVYAYVPNMIRYYLNDEPLLANVETRLCREPEGLEFTLDNLEHLVVKMVGGSGGYGMLVGPHATPAERTTYAEEILKNPANFISQPTLDLSCAPLYCTVVKRGWFPVHFAALPLLPALWSSTQVRAVVVKTSGCFPRNHMLSRNAQGLYWISRYLERAQHSCRLLADQLKALEDRPVEDIDRTWRRLYAVLDREPIGGSLESNLNDENFMLADSYTLADDLTFEPNNPDSIRNCIATARENARQVRNVIGKDMWYCLNVAYLELRDTGIGDIWDDQPGEFYLRTEDTIRTFSGIVDSTMYRDDSWHFLQLGRFIERAQLLATLVGAQMATFPTGEPHTESDWRSLLQICEARSAYSHQYSLEYRPDNVIDFLVSDPLLSHSIRYALAQISDALDAISAHRPAVEAGRLGGRMAAHIDYDSGRSRGSL